MRGEYDSALTSVQGTAGSPPLARGIPKRYGRTEEASGITPACAGNTIENHCRGQKYGDHPRLRGEYSKLGTYPHQGQGSPPLARGIRRSRVFLSRSSGITPACAGNTHKSLKTLALPRDHPRLRGEYIHRLGGRFRGEGSPPLARGIPGRSCTAHI